MTKGDIESLDKHIKKIGEINRENEQLARRAGYLEGKLEMLKKVRDAIAGIEQYNRNPDHYPVDMISIETVLQIIRKHTGVSE